MRKSSPPDKPPNGNAAKYLSYREAWTRIREARAYGFLLEAITIEESILSDRIASYLSYLASSCGSQIAPSGRRVLTFSDLIQRWKSAHRGPIAWREFEDLQSAVDEWRVSRNALIHQMVKSGPGSPTMDIDEFLARAESAAAFGARLARAVSQWCRKATHVAGQSSQKVPRPPDWRFSLRLVN